MKDTSTRETWFYPILIVVIEVKGAYLVVKAEGTTTPRTTLHLFFLT